MVTIIPVQQCQSLNGWAPIRIESSTTDQIYTVLTNPWGDSDEYVCECQGYRYRGHCHHQYEAAAKLCGWSELGGPPQDEEQRRNKICPACGGPTTWEMEVTEDDGER